MSSRTGSALAVGVTVAAALLLAGCAGTGFGSSNSIGVWSESSADDSPFLSLSDDGRVTGYDGCNNLTGTWTESYGNITFDEFATTQMACEDVDTWLDGAVTAIVEGDTMTISDVDEGVIGTLERTSETPLEE